MSSEQTIIKGTVSKLNAERIKAGNKHTGTIGFHAAQAVQELDDVPATLILGSGFSEAQVRKMLEEFISQSENASEIDWLKTCASKHGIDL